MACLLSTLKAMKPDRPVCCAYRNDQHELDCAARGRSNRVIRLTPLGNREAFLQSLERIMAK